MKVSLLIVDDEAEIRAMLERHYLFEGYDVTTAANGQEALAKMAEAKVDIVITDIMMPVMDGIDLLRAIRTHYPMVHSIVITGYVSLENALACMRQGADTCVFKPLEDLGQLNTAVQRAVEDIQRWLNILRELTEMKPGQSA